MKLIYGEPKESFRSHMGLREYAVLTYQSQTFTNPYTGIRYYIILEQTFQKEGFKGVYDVDLLEYVDHYIYSLDDKGTPKQLLYIDEYRSRDTPEEALERYLVSPQ